MISVVDYPYPYVSQLAVFRIQSRESLTACVRDVDVLACISSSRLDIPSCHVRPNSENYRASIQAHARARFVCVRTRDAAMPDCMHSNSSRSEFISLFDFVPLPLLSFKRVPVRMQAFDFSNQTSIHARNINCRLNRNALIKSICYDFCLFSFAFWPPPPLQQTPNLVRRGPETDADRARVLAAMFV